jgi:hypothetical protein
VHVLDRAIDHRPADHPVFARVRGTRRSGHVTAWHRTPSGWVAQVSWRTGPPAFSSCVDFLLQHDIIDPGACMLCRR